MPLTGKGKTILTNFKKEYGENGERYFYAKMNKDKEQTKEWHKKNK